jgi:fibronectin type 3 domain-containing protein
MIFSSIRNKESAKMRISKFAVAVTAIVSLLTVGLPVVSQPDAANAVSTIANLPARWDSISSPGTGTTCALAKNGTIWCWGIAEGPRGVTWNSAIGDPVAGSAVTPKQVGTATNWKKVVVATTHVCALNTLGEIWCWGSNTKGQLGNGTFLDSQTPVLAKAFGKIWREVASSQNQTCALTATGQWCWGTFGSDLNLPTFFNVTTPVFNLSSELQIGQVQAIRTNGRIYVKTSSGTGDFFELAAPLGQTWASMQVRVIGLGNDGVDNITTENPRMFSICGILSSGQARCYLKYDWANFAQLGTFSDWVSLSRLGDIPREPICGIRGIADPKVVCFSAYGSATSSYSLGSGTICGGDRSITFPGFTNAVTYPLTSSRTGSSTCGYNEFRMSLATFSGVLSDTASIELTLPEGRVPAKLEGGWFQGSVASDNAYSVWGRLYSLTTDGRLYAIGDGKYGERQDGLATNNVTDVWAPALTQTPTISSLNRNVVPKTGGATITLSGSFLVGVTGVAMGSIEIGSWTESTDGTTLTFTSPTNPAGGSVGITVRTIGGDVSFANAITYGDSPEAPAITGISPGDLSAVINWSAPASTGSSAITSYVVTATPGGATCTWTFGPLSCTLNGLTNGSTYRVNVRAMSAVGPGLLSATSSSFVPFKAPGAPTISSVQAADRAITVSWTPSDNNGSAITRYDVEAQPGGASCSTTGTGSTCTITGLSNGTAYSLAVYASNDAGGGEVASYPMPVTPRTMAGAPTILGVNAGDRQLTVNWRAPTNNGGSPVTAYTVMAQPGGVTCTAMAPATTCNLLGLSNGSVYTITVVATNPAGDSEASASVNASPVTIPGKPTINAVEPGANSMLVRWRAPAATGGASVSSYTVVATPGGGTCTTTGAVFYCVIGGLENGVTYSFAVTATNSAGAGSASSTYNGVPAAAPGVPRNVVAVPTNAGLSVTWAAPSYDGGAAVSGYTATIRSTGDVCNVASNALTCTFASATGVTLANGTAYIVDVVAVNSAGRSDSTASNSVTPRTVSTKPTQVALLPGAGTIRVSWAAPVSDGGSSITSYVAVSTPGSISCTTTGYYCDLIGVTPATSYSVRVYANNAAGAGEQSTAISATPYTTPGAPTSIAALADDTQINVSWAAPTSNGGSDITGYTAISSPGGLTCVSPSTSTSCSIRGLTNGSQYTIKVIARNSAGDGAEAVVTGKVTPRGAPSAPTLRGVDAGDKQVTVRWTALSGALLNGAPITRYTALAMPSMRTCSVDGSNASGVANTSCVISGLTNGIAQTITVTAANEGGTSAASTAIIRAARSTPSAPLAVVVSPLNQALSVSWSAPLDNGGALITAYTVVATPANSPNAAASTCAPQSGESRNCVISNLSNGTSYSVTVRATNDVGDSPLSDVVSQSPSTVPSAPTKVTGIASSGQIAIKWTASQANGSDIVGYHVTVQPGNYGCDVTDLSFLGCTITDLDNGVPYSISVYATNAAGDSPRGQVVGTVTPRAIPSAPAAVFVSPANGSATVVWIPGFDGGSPIRQYLVVASPGGAQCTAVGTATQCVMNNLVNGSQYTFSVTAINDAGSSQPIISARNTIAGTPNAPVALKVKPLDSSILVSFVTPAIDGGNRIINYTVFVNDEEACTVAPAKILTCTVENLVNGVPQAVRVVANNAIGSSASTAEVVAIPGRVAAAVTNVTATRGIGSLVVTWDDAADDGGSPITGYTVTLTPGGKTCKTEAEVLQCEFTALTVGTTYVAKVVAVNGVGISAAASAPGVKIVSAPSVVRSVSAVAGVRSAKIYFVAPVNTGGSAITNYYFTVTGPNDFVYESDAIPAGRAKSGFLVPGLTKGLSYTVLVTAENEFGMSSPGSVTVKSK